MNPNLEPGAWSCAGCNNRCFKSKTRCNKCGGREKKPDHGVWLGSAVIKAPTGAFKWTSHTLPKLELLGFAMDPAEATTAAWRLLRRMDGGGC